MKFQDFSIHASPFFTDAYCRKCRNSLEEVSNGLLSIALFCPKCEIVYQPKLVKVNKKNVSKEYLRQCREEVKKKHNKK